MKITIKGHPTRGKEVIQILESLGGRNTFNYNGDFIRTAYFIGMDYSIYGFCTDSSKVGFKVYTLEEFEKEFPFKIGDKVIIIGLPDFPKIITKITWDRDAILYSFEDSNNTWFHADALKKFEMKEERNITLTLDKAKEWYKKGGELKEIALQAFTEKELNPLPRNWEEFVESTKFTFNGSLEFINGLGQCNNGCLPNKSIGESSKIWDKHVALFQLEQLRNCWWNGWEPIWDCSEKWCIHLWGNELGIGLITHTSRFLTFPTKEMAEEFLKCFRDLIEKAGDLI